jgi:hypothetical protein
MIQQTYHLLHATKWVTGKSNFLRDSIHLTQIGAYAKNIDTMPSI